MSNFKRIIFYILPVCIFIPICIELGAELITQYSMHVNGYTDVEKHLLADDMGFGFLLMLGLIPEIILGVFLGYFTGKKLNSKFNT
ncbi:hypothetical protein CW745_16105 [Psychromonas sp. psych-6C06]|uniref:hypothetical protein n=1 Tax=Psychromonas sp. psych-6C06 TaxID=2058089 RepID=UPI000C32B715|nr:hypothetical protein [Psychromonas sp. psych-6C06]PKF60229.1 hypothetical protein CW745_16105 [Psychromonas sp. psych-6C06]